ncbi:SusC/RagA family TonB-linked outer membrane protein [Niastella vici]|uniref:SusC/RagA family TonB-linked outer membrane protein n=1 Tax=Niastella vici TaxID=1703345 RepID=A0A1V9G145_9BACT|nr:TonB-dependent receptor [Niastella vici]OQP64359.1 SusC/RagA family TonB-linked outer membrane protein [Niastella vici]
MSRITLVILLCVSPFFLFAQSRIIKGTITDEKGLPMAGVSVLLKNTQSATNGTQTDAAGKFTLTVNAAGKVTLVFSYLGYKKTEASTDGSKPLEIQLDKEDNNLDDVVVIGYGKAKKRDLTGAVGIVSGKDLMKTPVANAAEALTGKVAGLQITTTEGSPDAEIKVRLRGGTSISQDNSPLYIVDGFPVSNINNIAASSIETLTFLKDAASTAIYGSRASNGVFLITTKEGKAGKLTVSANAYGGFRKITKELNVLNPYEYVKYQYEVDPDPASTTFENYYGEFKDLDIYKSIKGTDWQKEVFGRSAQQRYYNVNLNGGSKTTRFNLGLTRNKEESIMLGSGYERNNLDFKLNGEITPKLTFDFNTRLGYMKIDGAGVNVGAGSVTRLRNSIKYAPTRGLSEFDQSAVDDNTVTAEDQSLLYDPVASANDEYKKQTRLNSTFNGGLTWKIMEGLSFRSEGGFEFRNERTDNVWGPHTYNAQQYAGQPIGNIYTLGGTSYRISNYVTFDKPNLFPGQNLNVVAGQESMSSGYKEITNESRFFPALMKYEEVLANMNFGTPIPTVTYIAANDRMNSYFGRLNYTFNNKYILTATFRADGSSKFAKGHQWGYFPSVAGAWKISEEEWLNRQAWLSQLKLRASYGATGNNRIQAGQWQMKYITSNENKPYYLGEAEARNFIPDNLLYNPLLKWETTLIRNVGLDFAFFNNRLSGTVDLYQNTTKDLLIQQPVPPISGYTGQLQNAGQTTNRGIELTLDGALVNTKDFSLSVAFNIGFNRNRVDKFKVGDLNYKAYSSGWNGTAQPLEDYLVKEGQPVGQMYGYVTDGMYTFDDFTFNNSTKKWELNKGVPDNSALISPGYFGPGILKFKDISGAKGEPDDSITTADKTVIGNANPKHSGGFNLNMRFKGFDFLAFFNWTYGNKIYNANKIDYTTLLLSRKYQNVLAEMDLNHRFTIIDPETGYNVATGANANPERLMQLNENATIWSPLMTVTPLHSWAIEDGSFLRLNTVTVGYTIPRNLLRRAHIANVRVYVTAYNLHTWTNYSGFDPEVDTRRSPPLTPGVDFSAYPKSRSFVGGINVTF